MGGSTEIARRLGADAVVEGSVTRAGERVRISAQLIDARSDQHLCADSHDRDLIDALDLQDQVARDIVKGIRSRLDAPEGAGDRPTAQPRDTHKTVDPEAYVEYLRGRHAWTRRTPGALRQAIACYERALERDPTYARAYAGIAECHSVLGFFGASAPRNAFPPAMAAARRALELDPSPASGYIALGYATTHYRWDFGRAADAFEQGLRWSRTI